jgi:hypothetical protein
MDLCYFDNTSEGINLIITCRGPTQIIHRKLAAKLAPANIGSQYDAQMHVGPSMIGAEAWSKFGPFEPDKIVKFSSNPSG